MPECQCELHFNPYLYFMLSRKRNRQLSFGRTSIVIWALFIAYEILFSYLLTGQLSSIFDYANAYAINILLFYFNALLVLPYIYKKPFYQATMVIILEFAGYTGLKYITSVFYFHYNLSEVNVFKNPLETFIQSAWRYIYFIGLSTGYWFSMSVIAQRKNIYELEKRKLHDQLNTEILEKKLINSNIAFLKSQINPHFLFNTLNFLYNSALETAPRLSEPILLLSDIMRYALTEISTSGKVNLTEEIEHINSLIALSQYRFDNKLNLSFQISGNTEGLQILPLLLLTPVENVFKYANLKDVEHPAEVKLILEGSRLKFTIHNKKLKSRKLIVSKGIGLNNLKSRLEAYYPAKHEIEILEDEEVYSLKININLDYV
jgi:two-component system LytT family sensor kinase